jgi:peptidoglycan/xylan/chitin deacetylase (PgdA/CDA1 family)
MAKLNASVITTKGRALIAKVQAGTATMQFTKIKTGNGVYTGLENLVNATALLNMKQEFNISSITIEDTTTVKLKTLLSNEGLAEGYYITEIGLFAQDPIEGMILYSITTAINGKGDYFPAYDSNNIATIILENYATVAAASSTTIKAGTGALALAEDVSKLETDVSGFTTTFNGLLAETATNMNRELISRRNRKPMISIIDDDGRVEFLTKWVPILEEKDFKISIAVVTSFPGLGSYMTWDQLGLLKKDYGVELVNHSHTHPNLGELTEDLVRTEFKSSTEILKAKGYSFDIMVYPGGSQNEIVRQVCREYCRTGIYTADGVNTAPIETFKLSRQPLMPGTGEMDTVESYTAFIDEAIANNGWIVFMTHSQYTSFDAAKINAVIDYANTHNIEWVNISEGLDNIGNLIDIGDYTARETNAEYTILDADGIMHSKANKNLPKVTGIDTYSFTSVLSDFEQGRITITPISESGKAGFPKNSAGTLITNYAFTSTYPYQEYHCVISGKTFKRTWLSTNAWSEFLEYAEVKNFTKTITATIPANSCVDIAVNSTMTINDVLTGNPPAPLEAGVMYCFMINSTVGKVRFYNATASPITLASQTWNFSLIKG